MQSNKSSKFHCFSLLYVVLAKMGRTKSKSKSKVSPLPSPAVPPPTAPTYTAADLLAAASVHLISLEYSQAKSLCERAIKLVDSPGEAQGEKELTEAFELLGTVELELGELDIAREVSFNFYFNSTASASWLVGDLRRVSNTTYNFSWEVGVNETGPWLRKSPEYTN